MTNFIVTILILQAFSFTNLQAKKISIKVYIPRKIIFNESSIDKKGNLSILAWENKEKLDFIENMHIEGRCSGDNFDTIDSKNIDIRLTMYFNDPELIFDQRGLEKIYIYPSCSVGQIGMDVNTNECEDFKLQFQGYFNNTPIKKNTEYQQILIIKIPKRKFYNLLKKANEIRINENIREEEEFKKKYEGKENVTWIVNTPLKIKIEVINKIVNIL